MGLRDDVMAILRDAHCSSMDFTIAGLHVNGSGLQAVASYLADSRIGLEGASISSAGRYRYGRDQLLVRSDLSDDLEENVENRSLIVHEAVHALADIRNLSSMSGIQAEASGFIAQALYKLKFREGRAWRSTVAIHREALAVVQALRLNEESGVTVQWGDYAALREAILAHPTYASENLDATAGANGIRRRR